MEVGLDELEDEVEVAVVAGAEGAEEFYDVRVLELGEEGEFAVGALGVGGVLEGVEDFF